MMDIMFQKLTFTNEHITNLEHAFTKLINSILLIMVSEYLHNIHGKHNSFIDKTRVILETETFLINNQFIQRIDQNQVRNVTIRINRSVPDSVMLVLCVMRGKNVLGASNAAEFIFLEQRVVLFVVRNVV